MDFSRAVRTCLSKYVDFSGRARRSEYWYFVLFTFLVSLVSGLIDRIGGTADFNDGGGLVGTVTSLLLLLPTIAATARRLHDTGRSGWWQLLGLAVAPVVLVQALLGLLAVLAVIVVLLVWLCTGSGPANRFGPNPLEDAGSQWRPYLG